MGRPAKYPPEFQRDAVELVLASGRSINDVALSLGVKRGTLGNWVEAARDARARDADPDGLSESERVELQRLRRLNTVSELGESIGRIAPPPDIRRPTSIAQRRAGRQIEQVDLGRVDP